MLYYFEATVERIFNQDQLWYDGCKTYEKKMIKTEDGEKCTKCINESEFVPR